MHPDFDSPEAHLSRHPLPPAPEPDRTCPGCEGDGACWCDECEGRADRPHPTCEWCDGAGVYVRPEPSEAEKRERLKALERELSRTPSTASVGLPSGTVSACSRSGESSLPAGTVGSAGCPGPASHVIEPLGLRPEVAQIEALETK